MHIWTVTNQKGGVGKTTTVVTLAGLWVSRGQRVLVIDLDPHGSLTAYFGYDTDELETSVHDLFALQGKATKDDIQKTLLPTKVENLTLLPASMVLATLERESTAQSGLGLVIKKALALLANDYDVVLIDTAPLLGALMVNAIAAAQLIIIPVQTEFLAIKGLERMMHTLAMITSSSAELKYVIVPTMFDRRTHASIDTLRTLQQIYGEQVWQGVIPIDTKFRDASHSGLPLSLYAKDSRGARAYHQLLDDVIKVVANG